MLYIPYLFMARSLYLFTCFISCSYHQSLGRSFFNVQDAGFVFFFVLLRPSANLMRFTHIMAGAGFTQILI